MAPPLDASAVVDFAARHHGAITRRQAAELGLHAPHVRRLIGMGLVSEPVRGVLVMSGSPATFERLITVVVNPGIRLNVGGLPIVGRESRAGLPKADVTVIHGHRVTSLARTIVDLAGDRTSNVERLVDDFERRGSSLTWLDRTARQARRRKGLQVRGSWFQRLVAECVASPRVPGVEEEYVVRDEAGRFVARVDLAVPAVRLAVEAHSRRYHDGREYERVDEERTNRLAELGWDTRFLGWAVTERQPTEVRAYIERLVARRAKELGVELTAAR